MEAEKCRYAEPEISEVGSVEELTSWFDTLTYDGLAGRFF
jgi:hypothetical protein